MGYAPLNQMFSREKSPQLAMPDSISPAVTVVSYFITRFLVQSSACAKRLEMKTCKSVFGRQSYPSFALVLKNRFLAQAPVLSRAEAESFAHFKNGSVQPRFHQECRGIVK